ncbi:3394_t:CDS:2 [Racocetra fulgida]|uniref:3394_t:CDS:1 n=1 Tax=Racocetra fulgida TaxID=60492 RepID=A0A9N9GPX3_9GLOM|nr:3394_t:CDS:2 [Racocetra fulgida]
MQERNKSINSEMRFRHYSYPGAILTTQGPFDLNVEEMLSKPVIHIRRTSNDSIASNDSGVGFMKADYEIQKAIRAQRVQRPHIIVLQKGKLLYQNHEDADANLVLNAAIASKKHRREIAVMQKRTTLILEPEILNETTFNEQEHDNTNKTEAQMMMEVDDTSNDDTLMDIVTVESIEQQRIDAPILGKTNNTRLRKNSMFRNNVSTLKKAKARNFKKL